MPPEYVVAAHICLHLPIVPQVCALGKGILHLTARCMIDILILQASPETSCACHAGTLGALFLLSQVLLGGDESPEPGSEPVGQDYQSDLPDTQVGPLCICRLRAA